MSTNNIVAPGIVFVVHNLLLTLITLHLLSMHYLGIEHLGVRTFSPLEICFNIIALLHPRIVAISQSNPVLADLNGGKQKNVRERCCSHSLSC